MSLQVLPDGSESEGHVINEQRFNDKKQLDSEGDGSSITTGLVILKEGKAKYFFVQNDIKNLKTVDAKSDLISLPRETKRFFIDRDYIYCYKVPGNDADKCELGKQIHGRQLHWYTMRFVIFLAAGLTSSIVWGYKEIPFLIVAFAFFYHGICNAMTQKYFGMEFFSLGCQHLLNLCSDGTKWVLDQLA